MGQISGTVYCPASGSIAFVTGIAVTKDYDCRIVALEIAGQKSSVTGIARALRSGYPVHPSHELHNVVRSYYTWFLKGGMHTVLRNLPGGITHATIVSRLCRHTQASPIPDDARCSYIIQPASTPSIDPSRLALRIRLQLNLPILPHAEEELARTALEMGLVQQLPSAGTIRGWAVHTDDHWLWEQCLVTATRRTLP